MNDNIFVLLERISYLDKSFIEKVYYDEEVAYEIKDKDVKAVRIFETYYRFEEHFIAIVYRYIMNKLLAYSFGNTVKLISSIKDSGEQTHKFYYSFYGAKNFLTYQYTVGVNEVEVLLEAWLELHKLANPNKLSQGWLRGSLIGSNQYEALVAETMHQF